MTVRQRSCFLWSLASLPPNITDSVDTSGLALSQTVPEVDSYRPTRDEDPFNVFITKCRIEGAVSGRLAGRTVGVKDNISVAGVPTTNGSRFTPYVPSMDAVVVERILGAGGTIVGKLNMDDFGAAGTGETSAFGAPRNPVNPAYSAGGSSGGSVRLCERARSIWLWPLTRAGAVGFRRLSAAWSRRKQPTA